MKNNAVLKKPKRKAAPSVLRDDSQMLRASKDFAQFKPAWETMTEVRAVQTIFPQFDHAVGVGGLPLERFTLVHGKSSHGKTLWTMGLILSFLQKQHYALMVDAERSSPKEWVKELLAEAALHPRFFYMKPDHYEHVDDYVSGFLDKLAQAKKLGHEPADTSAIIVIDSLGKLIPKDIMKKMSDSNDRGIDGMGGRLAQIQANHHKAWITKITPALERSGAALVAITRESDDPNADVWQKKYGNDYRVTGGRSIVYDASLVVRIERAAYVTEGGAEDRESIGEQHRITILKSKVAARDGRVSKCYFHSSNGKIFPIGFDRARDVFTLAEKFAIVERAGAWFRWESEKWNGQMQGIRALWENPDMLKSMEAMVRLKFKAHAPESVTEDGEVI